MREILFRGKRLDNGEWVYGDISQYKLGHTIVSASITEQQLPFSVYQISLKTISQYTNLKDKNGTRIFEGDIVRYGETVHEVVFEHRNGTAYFGLVYSPIETLPFGHYQDLKQIEVIGNIHDNPELIEKECEQ